VGRGQELAGATEDPWVLQRGLMDHSRA
jgi:hypothetical protein